MLTRRESCNIFFFISKSVYINAGMHSAPHSRFSLCNGYLGYPFEKKTLWTGFARLSLSVRWNTAIDPEGESFSLSKENIGVGATNHQGRHAQAAGEACHRHL
jgi:hypothetical protein